MYSTHNEGKSVDAERFIRTIKNKIYKHMTSISKNVYTDKLDDIVNEYNNTKHRTTKMKQVGDHVRISKYKNIFAKCYPSNWFEEILLLKKLKIQFHGYMSLMNLMVKKLQEHFMKKNCKR